MIMVGGSKGKGGGSPHHKGYSGETPSSRDDENDTDLWWSMVKMVVVSGDNYFKLHKRTQSLCQRSSKSPGSELSKIKTVLEDKDNHT